MMLVRGSISRFGLKESAGNVHAKGFGNGETEIGKFEVCAPDGAGAFVPHLPDWLLLCGNAKRISICIVSPWLLFEVPSCHLRNKQELHAPRENKIGVFALVRAPYFSLSIAVKANMIWAAHGRS